MSQTTKRAATVLALCLLVQAVAARAGGFRGNEWGAPKAEVKAREKHTLHHDMPGELAYFAFRLAGVEAGLVYKFDEDDRLTSAYYMSRHRTSDPEEDLADYEAWLALFDEHFGAHETREWKWKEGVAPGAAGLAAVTSGKAELVTRWMLEDGRLRLVMQGRDGAVTRIRAYFEPPGEASE